MMNREKQKKEQKTFEYIENPEQIEGFDKITVNPGGDYPL